MRAAREPKQPPFHGPEPIQKKRKAGGAVIPGLRHAMAWYTQMGRRVWPYEIIRFFIERRVKDGPTVAAFWGAPQDAEEESMTVAAKPARKAA